MIDTETDAYFSKLLDYGEYTVRYTFNAYKSGKLNEPSGKILQYAFLKIAGDEYIKTAADTGKEYFDEFDKHAKSIAEKNKIYDKFKAEYPYTYIYITEYMKQ